MLSPSMIAKLTHRIQPVAPVSQSVIAPGAHPRARAYGPNIPKPAGSLIDAFASHLMPWQCGSGERRLAVKLRTDAGRCLGRCARPVTHRKWRPPASKMLFAVP